MTTEQRLFDFEHVAAQYAKFYAPYEWKRDLLGFDLYNIAPWLERVRNAKSDLEYYEIAAEYVASLNDTHSAYYLPSNFVAFINISVDIFDGKYLIEAVNRAQFPTARYPFTTGDEIVSIDGQAPAEIAARLAKFYVYANERATRRLAANYLFFRAQQIFPRAHEIGDTATVVVRRQSGDLETYELPWTKRGVPITDSASVPSIRSARAKAGAKALSPAQPDLLELLARFQRRHAPATANRLIGFGSRAPFFILPPNFQRRLGSQNTHFHFSGVYTAEGKRIGYLRFPSFAPSNEFSAYIELINEIDFLQRNTDGLVVDIAHNPGGSCYGEMAANLLIPRPFYGVADEVRPSRADLLAFESALASPPPPGAEQWQIDLARFIYQQLATAYSENRGRTGPIALCNLSPEVQPLTLPDGSVFAYTKPLIVLTDEFSVSMGDYFARMLSDAKRGPLFGYRTNGAGGAISSFDAGYFSEGEISVTTTIGVRQQPVQQPGYPTTSYFENVGIWPDIPYDVMTVENLRSGYAPYVQAFTRAILDEINKEAK